MHETIALAAFVADLLNDAYLHDGGADTRITLFDTAGHLAEIEYHMPARRWIADEGLSDTTLLRIRHATESS